jgi:Tol biopolymer transport system component
MTPERWQRIEELYHAALARNAESRAAFLADTCPDDDDLRREVESLLSEPDSTETFLERPALVQAAEFAPAPVPALMTGRTIGGYQLVSLLGAGGMGEVYRAHDAKLAREVAVKVLPAGFTNNADRLARFEREARMLAALNHPNICAIYGTEEADGIRLLALELVEGKTLAEILAGRSRPGSSGGLPRHEVLRIAGQIAEALEAAHERGIIHRDLKPANVKITPDGLVKVLDFGLAKAVSGDGSAPSLTLLPSGGHRDAALLGTAAYMSPEQARGLAVDRRTDIWAFGCVLYEMLTGRVAFAGDTVSDTIAHILRQEPDWSSLPADTPGPIRRLLLRCLVKDPKQRQRDIGDVRIELDAIAEHGDVAEVAPQSAGWLPTWIPWVAIGAVALTLAAREASRPAQAEYEPLANARFTQVTDWDGTEGAGQISPDGRFVTFVADRDGKFDLWWSQLGSGEFRNLTADLPARAGPGILRGFGFSDDGAEIWLNFGAETAAQGVMLMPQTGGTLRPFLGAHSTSAAWSADDRLVYMSDDPGDPLMLADRRGADAHPIAIAPSDPAEWSGASGRPIHNHNPVWSMDDQWIYFVHGFVHGLNQADEMDIWRIRPTGGAPERLTHLNTELTFLAAIDARTLLYVARTDDGSGPWMWTLDVKTRVTRRVSSGLEQYTCVSASRDGRRIIATRSNPTTSLWRVPLGDGVAEDRDESYPVQLHRALAPRFGGTSLFYLSGRGTGDGLWRYQDAKSVEILKGTEWLLTEPPAVSPDGSRVAVVRRRDGQEHLAIMRADGTESRTLVPSVEIVGAADWSPDGNWIVSAGRDAQGLALFKIPVDGGTPVRLIEGDALNPIWSPDGRTIVYAGPLAAGQVPLRAVRPDGTSVSLPAVRVRPGAYRFLRDGTGLVYLPRARSADFWLLDLSSGKTRPLTHLRDQGRIQIFDVTPDGKYIVFDRARDNSDIVLIDLPK